MIRFATIGLALAATLGTANAQSDPVKRGDYLVNTIMTCGNCHTPKGRPRRSPARIFPAASLGMSRPSR